MTSRGRFISVKEEEEVFVIGDIHGCLETFRLLLKKIGYNGDSPLFLLGDYINKGPLSRETLDYLINLTHRFPSVYPLLGNHDSYLLSFLTSNSPEWLSSAQHAMMQKAGNFLGLAAEEKSNYVSFLSSLPLYYETESAFIVHAGFNFQKENPFDDQWAMLNIRSFDYDARKLDGKKIIHGHLPHSLEDIGRAIDENAYVIPLDNGCVYAGEETGMGHLCCLELNKMRLTVVENADN